MSFKKDSAADAASTKILSVFTFAFLGLLGLMVLNRYLVSAQTVLATIGFIRVTAMVAPCVFVLCYALTRWGKDLRFCRRHPKLLRILGGVAGGVFLCFLPMAVLDPFTMIKVLYVALPVVAVVYLIYHVYQREFFVQLLAAGLGSVGLYALSRLQARGEVALSAVLVGVVGVALIAAAGLLQKARGQDGALFGRDVLEKGANYAIISLTLVLVLAGFMAAYLTNASITYILMYVLLGYLLVLAIYYTVRLI